MNPWFARRRDVQPGDEIDQCIPWFLDHDPNGRPGSVRERRRDERHGGVGRREERCVFPRVEKADIAVARSIERREGADWRRGRADQPASDDACNLSRREDSPSSLLVNR
jgi:hypothetical protein